MMTDLNWFNQLLLKSAVKVQIITIDPSLIDSLSPKIGSDTVRKTQEVEEPNVS